MLEGLENQNPQTLQKVKGVLIGDLELSIPEVQKILENFPLTIKRSESQSDLSVHYESLKSAGAKVLLLKKGDETSTTNEDATNEIEFNLENPISLESIKNKEEITEEQEADSSDNSIEFEFDLDSITKSASKDTEQAVTAYEININEDTDLSLKELENELGESLQLSEPGAVPAKTEKSSEFSFDLLPAETGLDLIDSPALANVKDDAENWEADKLSESLISSAVSESEKSEQAATAQNPMSKIEESLFSLNEESDDKAGKETQHKNEKTKQITPSLSTTSTLAFELDVDEDKKEIPAPHASNEQNSIKSESNAVNLKVEKDTVINEQKENIINEIDSIVSAQTPQTESSKILPKSNKTKTKSKKKNLPAEVLLPIAVGGLLLGIVNWLYFSSKDEVKADISKTKIAIPEKALTINKSKMEENILPEAPSFNYSGGFENEDYNLSLKLTASLDKISNSLFVFNSAKPSELTPEEIVQGIEPRVWLKKADAENIQFEKDKENPGLFTGIANTKLYFEQGQERMRIIGATEITVNVQDNTAEVTLKMSLNSKTEDSVSDKLNAYRNDQNQLAVTFRKTLTLNKDAPISNETITSP